MPLGMTGFEPTSLRPQHNILPNKLHPQTILTQLSLHP